MVRGGLMGGGNDPGVAGVVHDLGNLIQIAASAVNVIGRSPGAGRDASIEPLVERARTALDRAGALVHQTMGRTTGAVQLQTAPDLQSIASCLEEIRGLIKWICEPDVTLSVEIAADLPPVRCNRIELQNVMLNLVVNARDAVRPGGAITVLVRPAPDAVLGEVVELRVADDGVGMSPSTLRQAFNPFFTTKGDGRGTGLGLAMVDRFARDAGGEVEIESALGQGTAVVLRLPPAVVLGGSRP